MRLSRVAAPILRPVKQAAHLGLQVADRLTGGRAGQVWRELVDIGGRGPREPSPLERQIGEVARGRPSTVAEVVARLDAIVRLAETAPRGQADGIACFTRLYRTITANVLRWLQEGRFEDSQYLETLDLEFAERYFEALRAYAFDRPATPMCWRLLFDNRSDRRISRLHFAVAGVNAHINFDLAFATISTCTRLGVEFGAGVQYQDYLGVNQIFAANTLQLREQFEAEEDPALVDAVEKLFDDFLIVATRDVAWQEAQRMWPHRADQRRMDQETGLIDLRAAVLGRGMLANPLLR